MGGCASKPKVKEGDVATKPLVAQVPEKKDDFAAKSTVVEKKLVPEKRDDFAAKNTAVEKKLATACGEDNATKRCYPNNSFTERSMKEKLSEPSKCGPQETKSKEEHTHHLVASMDSSGKIEPDSSPKSKEKLAAKDIKTLLLQTTLNSEENIAKETLLDLSKIENYSSESNNDNIKTEEKQAKNTLKYEILHDKSADQNPIEENTQQIEISHDELDEKHSKSLMENEIADKEVENPLKLEGIPDEKTEQISHDENTLRQESLIDNTAMEKPIEDTSQPEKEMEENHAKEDTLEPEKNTEEESAKNTHKSDSFEEENILETKLSPEVKPIQENNRSSDVIKMEEDHEEYFTKMETQPAKREEENMKPQQPEIPWEKETEAMLLDQILMKEMEEKWLGR